MSNIQDFSSMTENTIINMESDVEYEVLTIEFDEHIRRISEIRDTLKDLPELYSNHFTAIECLRQTHFNNSRVNITEEFLVRLGELVGDINLVRDRFGYFQKNLGWGFNGNFDYPATEVIRFIHSSQEHELLVSELASYNSGDLLQDLSSIRNNLIIIYTLFEDSDITPEFILTRKSELLIDGQRCNVVNTTSEDVEEILRQGYADSVEVVGDFPILVDELNELADVFENNNYRLSDYDTYNIRMDKLCNGVDGFICNNRTNGLSKGLVKQAIAEMVIQRGKGVALLTDKAGQFIHESKLLFNVISGEYISSIPNITNKVMAIRGMSKLLLYSKQDNMFLAVLDSIPDITVICTHYCAFDESHRTFIKMREDNRVPFNQIVKAEDVMEFDLTGRKQSENRELLCKFAVTREGGIDLNNCIFFKRDGITYIGVDCTIDINCNMYIVPYEGSSDNTSVLSKNIEISDLSSLLPLDCTIFNTERVNSLLDKISSYRSERIYGKISKNMSVTLNPLTSIINNHMIKNNFTEDKRPSVINYCVSRLDWSVLLKYMDYLTIGASDTDLMDISTFVAPSENKQLGLTYRGIAFLRKIGILPKDSGEEQTLLMVINEFISRKITKDIMIEYVRCNLDLLNDYSECEKELDYIKGLVGNTSEEAKKDSIAVIEQILSNNMNISSNVFKLMSDMKNSYINKLFAGYMGAVKPLKVDDESLRFVADKYPILLRQLKVLDFEYSKIGLTAFEFLSNFQAEDIYKRNNQNLYKELNVMREVSQYNEFNIPVLTKNYTKGGQLSLYSRGAEIKNE